MRRILLSGLLLCVLFVNSFNRNTSQRIAVDSISDSIVLIDPVVKIDTIPSLTVENLRAELIKKNIPQYKIVLAQALHETGNFKSKICRERNNIFGMRTKKGYKYYDSWVDCVDDYEKRFSRRYKGGDYFKFLISVHYHEDPMYEQRVRRFI